jgi:hypothetical protein
MAIGKRSLRSGILLACVLSIGFAANAARIKEDPNGFNGHQWGAPLAAYPGFKHLQDLGSTDFVAKAGVYENPEEVLTLNDVPIKAVRYRFINEQMESINLRYEGRNNRERLMAWLEERFGKLSLSERKMLNSVQWFGDKTTVTLTYNPRTQEGAVWFTSQVLNHLFNDIHQGSQGD